MLNRLDYFLSIFIRDSYPFRFLHLYSWSVSFAAIIIPYSPPHVPANLAGYQLSHKNPDKTYFVSSYWFSVYNQRDVMEVLAACALEKVQHVLL